MPFHLFYRGPLRANGDIKHKHSIRTALHRQLAELWKQQPLSDFANEHLAKSPKDGNPSLVRTVGSTDYTCIISDKLHLHAELDILFLRPQAPGQIVGQGGDIDNRLKTLFDALRCPQSQGEVPKTIGSQTTPNPCHCLLADDGLITRVNVTTDRLFGAKDRNEVVLVIKVSIPRRTVTYGNISYIH